jgi:hypothetical protein
MFVGCSRILSAVWILSLPAVAIAGPNDVRHPSLLGVSGFDTVQEHDGVAVAFTARSGAYGATVRSNGFTLRDQRAERDSLSVAIHNAVSTSPSFEGREAGLRDVSAHKGNVAARHSAVRYSDVIDGIDVLYRVSGGELEFDFIIGPGSSVDDLRLDAIGSARFSSEPSRDVILSDGVSRFRLKRPLAYQMDGDRRLIIDVDTVATSWSLRFLVGEYDQSKPLIIDPLVSTYSTFVGTNSQYDEIRALATDAQGNIYLAGLTSYDVQQPSEHGFPRTPSSLLIPHPTADNECHFQCGYILKLNPSHEVVYAALMYSLKITAIAVDVQQNVYFTGRTDVGMQFPWTPSSFDTASLPPTGNAITPQAFVAKLNASGSSLAYASLFVATEGKGIAVDSTGSAFVVGVSEGPGLPTTAGSIKPIYQDRGEFLNQEGFLLKVSPSGATLDYATYLGGLGTDDALSVTVNDAGHAVVVGSTDSSDFLPALPGGPAGTLDGFIIEVAADGARITRSRFLGGSHSDTALSVAPDGVGGYLVSGATTSADFPVTQGVIQPQLLGARDGWIARLDANLTSIYATYFGGSSIDGVLSIVGDDVGNAYFAGVSFSADMLTTPDALQDSTGRVSDDLVALAGRDYYRISTLEPREAYLGVLSGDGSTLRHGSYLSGFYTVPRGYDALSIATAVARTRTGSVYVGGATDAESFPTTDGGLRSGMGGISDAFLSEWKDQPFRVTTESLLPVAELDGPAYATQLSASGGVTPLQWQVVGFRLIEGLTLSPGGLISGSARQAFDANGALLTESGAYQFTAKVVDATGAVAYKSFFLPRHSSDNPTCSNGVCVVELRVGDELPLFPPRIPNRALPPMTLNVLGALPPGIAVDANGEFRGRVAAAGRYRTTFSVQDAAGQSVALAWDINVVDPSSAPTPTPSPPAAPPSSAGSSGGGGQFDVLSLVALLCLLLLAGGLRSTTRDKKTGKSP